MGDMRETVIGIIYRHGLNDYELMIGDFPKEMRESILSKVELFDNGYNLAGSRGNRHMTLEDANIYYFERQWFADERKGDGEMYRTAIVDELNEVMWWCDELQGQEQIDSILEGHPEWCVRAIKVG